MAKGFKGPKGQAGGMGGMMGQLQKLQEQLQQAQAQLAEETVIATAGGGAVEVTVTGNQERCTAVKIDPDLLTDGDVEMVQDLVLTAINNALEKARALAAERMGPLTGGLPF